MSSDVGLTKADLTGLVKYKDELGIVSNDIQKSIDRKRTDCRCSLIVLALLALIAAGGAAALIVTSGGPCNMLSFYNGIGLGVAASGVVLFMVYVVARTYQHKRARRNESLEKRFDLVGVEEILDTMIVEGVKKDILRLMQIKTFTQFAYVALQKRLSFDPEGILKDLGESLEESDLAEILEAIAEDKKVAELPLEKQIEIMEALKESAYKLVANLNQDQYIALADHISSKEVSPNVIRAIIQDEKRVHLEDSVKFQMVAKVNDAISHFSNEEFETFLDYTLNKSEENSFRAIATLPDKLAPLVLSKEALTVDLITQTYALMSKGQKVAFLQVLMDLEPQPKVAAILSNIIPKALKDEIKAIASHPENFAALVAEKSLVPEMVLRVYASMNDQKVAFLQALMGLDPQPKVAAILSNIIPKASKDEIKAIASHPENFAALVAEKSLVPEMVLRVYASMNDQKVAFLHALMDLESQPKMANFLAAIILKASKSEIEAIASHPENCAALIAENTLVRDIVLQVYISMSDEKKAQFIVEVIKNTDLDKKNLEKVLWHTLCFTVTSDFADSFEKGKVDPSRLTLVKQFARFPEMFGRFLYSAIDNTSETEDSKYIWYAGKMLETFWKGIENQKELVDTLAKLLKAEPIESHNLWQNVAEKYNGSMPEMLTQVRKRFYSLMADNLAKRSQGTHAFRESTIDNENLLSNSYERLRYALDLLEHMNSEDAKKIIENIDGGFTWTKDRRARLLSILIKDVMTPTASESQKALYRLFVS